MLYKNATGAAKTYEQLARDVLALPGGTFACSELLDGMLVAEEG